MNNSNGYFIDIDESALGKCLVVTGAWRDEFVRIAQDQGVKVLRLSNAAGWKERDLSFIRDLHFLEGLEVFSFDVEDVSPIFELKGLRYLALQCNGNSVMSFEGFDKLEVCKIFWRKNVRGLWGCTKLRHLNIVDYPFSDLNELHLLKRIRRLQITSKKLTTLQGVGYMPEIQIFDAADCPKLTNLSDLAQCKCLESIQLDGCRQIGRIPEELGDTKLESILLNDCGKIESLAPLSSVFGLRRLKFIGDTNVKDGALDFLADLPLLEEVWFAGRRHYSVTREELASRLAAKRRR